MARLKEFYTAHRRHLRTAAILLAIGLVYYLFTQITDWYIPCPLRATTGLCCPGCGISHLCTDLLQGRFLSAAQQNLAVAVLAPVWLIAGVVYAVFRPATLRQNGRGFHILAWGSIVFLLVFAILRNIPAFSFLLPLYLQ